MRSGEARVTPRKPRVGAHEAGVGTREGPVSPLEPRVSSGEARARPREAWAGAREPRGSESASREREPGRRGWPARLQVENAEASADRLQPGVSPRRSQRPGLEVEWLHASNYRKGRQRQDRGF